MKRRLKLLAGDTALWVIYFLMSIISLVAVFSTIGYSAISESNSTPLMMFFKHLGIVLTSLIVIIFCSRINYRYFANVSLALFGISLVLLVIAAIMKTRWISVFHLFSFQPSEMAKLMLMVVLARTIAMNRDNLQDSSLYWKLLIPIFLVFLLVFDTDLSTGILIVLAGYLLLFLGGVCKRLWLKGAVAVVVLGAVAFAVIYFFGDHIDLFRTTTWNHRLEAWIHPNPNELTQENMARMAVARGGVLGNGVGTTIHGRLMTQAHNDFIYAIIIEEAGLLCAFVIFVLYTWFYFRCIRIASKCEGLFGSLCVAGIGTTIILQAFVNMAVAVGVLPVTGQTLPFISYGGTSYLILAFGVAIIQSVAIDNKKKEQSLRVQEGGKANLSEEGVKPSVDMSNSKINAI